MEDRNNVDASDVLPRDVIVIAQRDRVQRASNKTIERALTRAAVKQLGRAVAASALHRGVLYKPCKNKRDS